MRILLANDDGIDAPGLAVLETAARLVSDDLWIVAPDRKRSASSHSITLHEPYSVTKVGERRYRCDGTPVDGVIAAMAWLLKDEQRPHLVLSGINDGLNVAEDVAYSGTLAIAREATFWNVPAIALSQAKGGEPFSPMAVDWLGQAIRGLWEHRSDWCLDGHWLSLNLPPKVPAPIRHATIGRDKIARDVDVLRQSDQTVHLRVRNGRSHQPSADDETALIAAGCCTLVRLNWPEVRPLPAGLTIGTGPRQW